MNDSFTKGANLAIQMHQIKMQQQQADEMSKYRQAQTEYTTWLQKKQMDEIESAKRINESIYGATKPRTEQRQITTPIPEINAQFSDWGQDMSSFKVPAWDLTETKNITVDPLSGKYTDPNIARAAILADRPDLLKAFEIDSDKENKYTLENITAGKVRSGEMTLEEAYGLENKKTSKSPVLIGFDPTNNQPVYENKETGGLVYGTGQPYTGGQMKPKTLPRPLQVNIGITKATQTELEKGQMEKEQQIMELDEIESLYKDEYLTYKGQGQAFIEKLANKAGFIDNPTFLANRTQWFVQAKSAFFKYRKWVTGVAGGQPEMVDIAKAYPDPERNSPTEYKANLKQSKTWAKKVLNWTKYTRAKGLSINDTPENMTAPKGAKTSVDLSGMSVEQLMEIVGGGSGEVEE